VHYLKLNLIIGIITLVVNILCHDAFGYGLTYTPHISIESDYNDNIFFSEKKTVNDLVSVVNGGTDIDLSTERDDLTLIDNLSNISYLKNHELDENDFSVRANESHMLLERASIITNAGYIKDSNPDRDLESTGFIYSNGIRKTTNFSMKGAFSLTELLSTDLTGSYMSQKFNSNQFVDSTSQNFDMGYSYDAGSIVHDTTLRLDLLYEQDRYHDSPLHEDEIFECFAGASHQITELLNLSFNLGTNRTISSYSIPILWIKLNEKYRSQGIIGQLSLEYKTEYLDSTLGLSRNTDSVSGESYLTERTMATLDTSLTISRTIKAYLSAQYIINKELVNKASQGNINQWTINLLPGFRIELSDDLFLSLSYIFSQVRDESNSIDYRRNLSTLNIEYRHSFFN